MPYLCSIMEEEIVNKIAQSQLVTLDPMDFFSDETVVFDLKDFLFMEFVLKEKEFREALKMFDWSQFAEKNVTIYCSSDAIIPLWAYMLATMYLQPVARWVMTGTMEECKRELFLKRIQREDFSKYNEKRMILKGCGDASIPEYAYAALTWALMPFAKSIMYGEPCSTVPVYKKK